MVRQRVWVSGGRKSFGDMEMGHLPAPGVSVEELLDDPLDDPIVASSVIGPKGSPHPIVHGSGVSGTESSGGPLYHWSHFHEVREHLRLPLIIFL